MKDYVLGSKEDMSSVVGKPCLAKGCSKCGVIVYFSDKWDWTKSEAICKDCMVKKKKEVNEFIIKPQTVKRVSKTMNVSKKKVKEIAKDFVEDIMK